VHEFHGHRVVKSLIDTKIGQRVEWQRKLSRDCTSQLFFRQGAFADQRRPEQRRGSTQPLQGLINRLFRQQTLPNQHIR
jgi:hypothetical protein